jgi:curli biogenesis system outer membrane secretion channel CsgG
MLRIHLTAIIGTLIMLCWSNSATNAAAEIPIGPAYQGPKCVIAVGDFTVQARGAPQEIGDGLREMLQTALFESNHFIVVDRLDPAGITAEQLLSKSFLSNPDAIIKQGQMDPAEVMVYGAVTALEGGGWGLRLKVPGAPLRLGGAYHNAKVTIDLRVVDSASGQVVAAQSVEGTALSGRGTLGTTETDTALPLTLSMVQNTPLEVAIRDCIYRSVVSLVNAIPRTLFRHLD